MFSHNFYEIVFVRDDCARVWGMKSSKEGVDTAGDCGIDQNHDEIWHFTGLKA